MVGHVNDPIEQIGKQTPLEAKVVASLLRVSHYPRHLFFIKP